MFLNNAHYPCNLTGFIRIGLFTIILIIFSKTLVYSQLFGPQQQITGGNLTNVSTVYSDDLNNDNKLDVIGVSETKIVWYKNLGEGHFDFQKTIVDSLEAAYSVTADFDGDGDIDIAYASYWDHEVGWYENDGIGNFETLHIISFDIMKPKSLCSEDFDMDGDMDLLLISNLTHQVIMFQNDGFGNFTFQQVLLTVDYGIIDIGASDLDDDGDKDILISHLSFITNESDFFWLENNGNGYFGIEHFITSIDISRFFVDDIDGDDDKDLLYTSFNELEIAWIENEGNGVFGLKHIVDDTIFILHDVCSFDFDNDGDNDVLASSGYNPGIFWYENNGNGIFSEMQNIVIQGANDLSSCDLDNDGYIDFSSCIQEGIAWFKNQGNNTFSDPLLLTTKTNGVRDVYAADLDGDGDHEIISASPGDGKIAWYENISYQTFGSQIIITDEEGHSGDMSVVSCDLDNDTDQDILCGCLHNYQNKHSIIWFENDGLGDFDTARIIAMYTEVSEVCSADLDGDGDYDVLVAAYEGIQWYENYGNGNFGTKQTIEWIYDYNNSVFASDLDGDEDIDVLFTSQYGKRITYYKNDGFGFFSDYYIILQADVQPTDVIGIDLNNDGNNDVIASLENRIVWFENLGNGNFGTEKLISDNIYIPGSLFSTDLDNDGNNDLLYGYSSTVIWHKNLGNGTFGEKQIITNLASGVRSIFATDLDSDGDNDVISASSGDGKIAWYENLLITTSSENGNRSTQVLSIYPNPFTISATFAYDLLKPGQVVITMYNHLGQR